MTEVGFYPSRRLKKRNGEYFAYLNVWPFVGVMIFLLAFMMVGTAPSNICTRGISPDLPAVLHAVPMPLANREDAMHLMVTRDGKFYFGNLNTAARDLAGKIRESVRSGSERRVYLSIDARARYGDVKQAKDEVRDAGIEKVSLLSNRKRN